ncbi:MAG: choline ABC transporter ATP-binding protein [Paracoccaceae bacterium]
MSVAVEIENVSIVFGDRPEAALPMMDAGADRSAIQAETGQVLGVHDCSLDVETGEIVVLMGLSGSGKSTLLRAINGLNPLARGRVTVHGDGWRQEIGTATAAELRRVRREAVAMVFQQFALLPWRTVRENVGLGLELAGLSRRETNERVEAQLDLVGLSGWADRRVGELSGGMQQRVGLARAFATEAPVLLMDEPFSALDPLIRAKLQDALLELQQRLGRTLVFVTHDLDEAFKLGNRIAIMEGGRIVQTGTPSAIFRDPADDYVAEFVRHLNPLGVLRARDLMGPPDETAETAVAADALVRDVLDRLLGANGPVGVEEDGRLVGRLRPEDVLAGLARRAPEEGDA